MVELIFEPEVDVKVTVKERVIHRQAIVRELPSGERGNHYVPPSLIVSMGNFYRGSLLRRCFVWEPGP